MEHPGGNPWPYLKTTPGNTSYNWTETAAKIISIEDLNEISCAGSTRNVGWSLGVSGARPGACFCSIGCNLYAGLENWAAHCSAPALGSVTGHGIQLKCTFLPKGLVLFPATSLPWIESGKSATKGWLVQVIGPKDCACMVLLQGRW